MEEETASQGNLRMINVVNVYQCLKCPSAHIAQILFTDRSIKRMFYCSSGDCDNWALSEKPLDPDFSTLKPPLEAEFFSKSPSQRDDPP